MAIQNSDHKIEDLLVSWGKRTFIMGILNITPDSFSGDGLITKPNSVSNSSLEKESSVAAAVKQAREFVEAGVDILDVGGESTRPGAEPVTVSGEIDRVLPVIQALLDEFDVMVTSYSFLKTTLEFVKSTDSMLTFGNLANNPSLFFDPLNFVPSKLRSFTFVAIPTEKVPSQTPVTVVTPLIIREFVKT